MKLLKNIKFNTLKTKVNCLEKKIPDTTKIIHQNQYNTGKQSILATATVLNTKIR